MKTTRVVLALIVFALCAFITVQMSYAAEMPWKKFNDPEMLSVGHSVDMGTCPNGKEAFIAVFDHPTLGRYVMMYGVESHIIAFYYGQPGDPRPVEIGIGTVDKDNNNEIPPLRWQKYNRDIHGNGCLVVYPQGA